MGITSLGTLEVLFFLLESKVLLVFILYLLSSKALFGKEMELKLSISRESTLSADISIWFFVVDIPTECALEGTLSTGIADIVLCIDRFVASGTEENFFFY